MIVVRYSRMCLVCIFLGCSRRKIGIRSVLMFRLLISVSSVRERGSGSLLKSFMFLWWWSGVCRWIG